MKLIKFIISLVVLLVIAALVANVVIKQQGGGAVDVSVERIIDKPITTVFGQLANHAEWKQFPGIADSELLKPGTLLKNGVGAVRQIKAVGGFTVIEEIKDFLPPVRMEYQIQKSSPITINHEYGRLKLRPEGLLSTRVTWTSKGTVEAPLVDAVLGWFVAREVEKSFINILESMNSK